MREGHSSGDGWGEMKGFQPDDGFECAMATDGDVGITHWGAGYDVDGCAL